MKKLLIILLALLVMTSCTTAECDVDEYVVEMNWNFAVKDLSMLE